VPDADDDRRLTRAEVTRFVQNWIGVSSDGYLGNFSYNSHDRFWLNTCNIPVDTGRFEGTTRRCFEETLFAASAADQARALRALLEEYPALDAPDRARPRFRAPETRTEILGWLQRLETGEAAVAVLLEDPSEAVRLALADAEVLIKATGPERAVDRVHTAMHGYLIGLCTQAGFPVEDRPPMTTLFKTLQAGHPMLADVGPRSEEMTRIVRSMANILDALNPVRNSASGAHPNEQSVGEPEARLVINTVHTLLNYLEAKLRQASEGEAPA